jgi:hypothetical protein
VSAELAPRTRDARPPAMHPGNVLIAAGLSLAAATLYWLPMLSGRSLRGHDWSTHHFHYFDWVRTSLLGYGTLPLYMADAWVTPNFLANAESPALGPLAWMLLFLRTDAYIEILIVLHTAAGLLGAFLLQRDLGVAPLVAALVAASFACGGFFASHLAIGHAWAMGAQLLPLLLLLYRRAALGSRGALVGAALVGVWPLLSGQHQPFVWQNLLLTLFALLWSLRARSLFPLARWAAVVLLVCGLGAVRLLPMLAEFASYAPTARIPGLPPALLAMTLAAPGQTAASTPDGLAYAHGAGWWEYAFYLGVPALLALLAGLVAARGVWPLVACGLVFLVLALQWSAGGEPSGPWRLLHDLPVLRTQRSPSRFLLLALFCFTMASGPGLSRLLADAQARFGRAALAAAAALLLAVGGDLYFAGVAWQEPALGQALLPRNHRPTPNEIRSDGVQAWISQFTPNRTTWIVSASQPARLVLPLRYGLRDAEWEVTFAHRGAADPSPLPVEPGNADGKLAIDVPQGDGDLVVSFRPPLLRAGIGISAATLAALVVAAVLRARARPAAG